VFKAGVLDGLKPQVTKREADVQSQAPVDAFNLRPAFALKLYDLAYVLLNLTIHYFSTVLRNKYHMILAFPLGM
jgi:hypothetical protein